MSKRIPEQERTVSRQTATGDRLTANSRTPRRIRYSDRQKSAALLALEANGGNYRATAREAGVPIANLHGWANGRGLPVDVMRQVNEERPALADQFEALAYKLVAAAFEDDGRIAGAGVKDLLIAAGIAIDKMRLLREQATSIHTQQLSDEERIARLNELLATALTLPEPAPAEYSPSARALVQEQPALEAHEEQFTTPREQDAALRGCDADGDEGA